MHQKGGLPVRIIKQLTAVIWLIALLAALPAYAQAETRALLIACTDFASQPDLGSAISGNIHMIGSTLISSDIKPGALSIEDGTLGTQQALRTAVLDTFSSAAEDDLSILYICTHGILSSADDEEVYLLLSDSQTETPLSGAQLYESIADIQGEKLIIIDACFSGALIGRGIPEQDLLPGNLPAVRAVNTAFSGDPSVHVLTSASGDESSWYYDSEHLSTGAASYFASALASGLGLYGAPEADLSGDGAITLAEIHRYLNTAVPSSSCQLLSSNAESIYLPAALEAALFRPLSGFSYGDSLLTADDPVLDFSFTVAADSTGVQYRLIEFADGKWDWEHALTFLDSGEGEEGVLTSGRKTRTLSLEGVLPEDSGYLMLQIFSVSSSEVILCSERLIGVQPVSADAAPTLSCQDSLLHPGMGELPVHVRLSVPAELTVTVYDQDGMPVRRLAAGLMTRPSTDDTTRLYWDGRDDSGEPVAPGEYVIACETRIGSERKKAAASVRIGK